MTILYLFGRTQRLGGERVDILLLLSSSMGCANKIRKLFCNFLIRLVPTRPSAELGESDGVERERLEGPGNR